MMAVRKSVPSEWVRIFGTVFIAMLVIFAVDAVTDWPWIVYAAVGVATVVIITLGTAAWQRRRRPGRG